MSQPRIALELDYNELTSIGARRAAVEAFHLDERIIADAARRGTSLPILATAGQFGLYVAYRNAYGGQNLIKSLNPKLIPNPVIQLIDVTVHDRLS